MIPSSSSSSSSSLLAAAAATTTTRHTQAGNNNNRLRDPWICLAFKKVSVVQKPGCGGWIHKQRVLCEHSVVGFRRMHVELIYGEPCTYRGTVMSASNVTSVINSVSTEEARLMTTRSDSCTYCKSMIDDWNNAKNDEDYNSVYYDRKQEILTRDRSKPHWITWTCSARGDIYSMVDRRFDENYEFVTLGPDFVNAKQLGDVKQMYNKVSMRRDSYGISCCTYIKWLIQQWCCLCINTCSCVKKQITCKRAKDRDDDDGGGGDGTGDYGVGDTRRKWYCSQLVASVLNSAIGCSVDGNTPDTLEASIMNAIEKNAAANATLKMDLIRIFTRSESERRSKESIKTQPQYVQPPSISSSSSSSLSSHADSSILTIRSSKLG